jgi:lipopolysaccharide export system protein LptA
MKRRFLSRFLTVIALPLLLLSNAHAEKADSQKEIAATGDKVDVDDIKQIRVVTGNVVLTQGTLIMKGAKLVITTSPDGWQFGTMYAPSGGLATMRQKRDGGPDLWMEGEASDRITYDEKTSIAVLYTNAKVRRLTGTQKTDESTAAYLSYNSQTEIVNGANTESGESKPGAGRATITMQPHSHPDDKKAQ